jgi:phage-related protein
MEKTITAVFYTTLSGTEPVRTWLKSLDKEVCKIIGKDIQSVEFRWPLGMPLVKKMDKDLWEIRSDITDGRIARVLFTVKGQKLYLLHGFIKKSQKTSKPDLALGVKRKNEVLKRHLRLA